MDKIVVLDYGSHFNDYLIRKLRDNGVYSLLLPKTTSKEKIEDLHHVKGIILSGGPGVIGEGTEDHLFDERLLELNIPILGICYGMEALATYLGAKVESIKKREYGKHVVRVDTSNALFKDIPEETVVYMSKNDKISELNGVTELAESSSSGLVAFQKDNIYGVLFHPEVGATEFGEQLLKNFIALCGCNGHWTLERYVENTVEDIRNKVGNERVLLGLSGGVDSAVAAILLHKAIGDNLTCLFIETGLHRKLEYEEVTDLFNKLGIKVEIADEGELFLSRLKGVIEADKKRKVISDTFIEIFKNYSQKLGGFKFLSQGTIYSDVKESRWGKKKVLVVDKEISEFELIEPIKQLTKREVRQVGRYFGLDELFITRQPFPLPGLAIRIIGEVTLMKLEILREANLILSSEIEKAGLDKEMYQYFCVLTNIDSVGVEGDNKIYYHTIAIRCVTSGSGVTADFYHFDMNFLEKVSRRIVTEVAGVNRVVYDITTKPPATIEYQ